MLVTVMLCQPMPQLVWLITPVLAVVRGLLAVEMMLGSVLKLGALSAAWPCTVQYMSS